MKNTKKLNRHRSLHIETLENRELLSVSPLYSADVLESEANAYDYSDDVRIETITDPVKMDSSASGSGSMGTINVVLPGINGHDPVTVDAYEYNVANEVESASIKWGKINGIFRLISFGVHEGSNVSGFLNLSGCTELKNVKVTSNKFTQVDVSGCTALYRVGCHGNSLRFSTILHENSGDFYLITPANQSDIPIASYISKYDEVDLSSEYEIDSNVTEYRWYYDDYLISNLLPSRYYEQVSNGVFQFSEDLPSGMRLYCTMRNDSFPGLFYRTTWTTLTADGLLSSQTVSQQMEIMAHTIAYQDLEEGMELGDGWKVHKVYHDWLTDFDAFIATQTLSDGTKEAVVVFRGSSSVSDWAGNVIGTINLLGPGFGQWAFNRNEVMSDVTQLYNQGYKISTTGHSRGGALAQMFASDWTASGRILERLETFQSAGVNSYFFQQRIQSRKCYEPANYSSYFQCRLVCTFPL